ncbi:MAG TPA: MBL fold metallo-hydrolase, partial [Spirochaetota bacterium]|nr:MBL fold metallo-hydrolase [Spirochaetota bacterium]
TKKIVFSGDLGPRDQAIIKNAEHIEDADFLLVESTYGDRIHKSKGDTYAEFKNVINEAHNKKGNIVIPSFAVERTQEIIHTLSDLLKNGEIPLVPVYIDSPLAISATEIFRKHVECYDDDMRARILRGEDPLNFPSLTYTKTTAESKELNKKAKGAIIISASGMCTAGRIKYHLQNNLYKKEASVVFVGYQAEGTLGRSLVEGAKRVKLYGEEVSVNAKIYTLGGFSGHADKDGLLEWVSKFKNKNMKIFVVHGEEKSSSNLASLISENFGFKTTVPSWGDIVDLNTFETTRMSYGVVPENIRTIDDDVEQIDVLVEAFIAKYQKAKNDKNMALMDRVGNDIEDLKAMIKRVSEKL